MRIHYFFTVLFLATTLSAEMPHLISYQGKLLENSVPVSGNHGVVFRIYDAPTGGNLVWQGDVQTVRITNGIFNSYVGETTGAGSPVMFSNINWASGAKYLEIQAESDILQPRERLTSVAYSLLAENVINGVPCGTIVPWGGTAANIPSGWLLCNGNPVSRSAYASLFGVLGTRYGAGDGSTTFNLPNFVTKFPRGVSDNPGTGAGSDTHSHGPGGYTGASHTHGVGTYTAPSHTHSGTTDPNTMIDSADYGDNSNSSDPANNHSHTFTTGTAGAGTMTGTSGAGGDLAITGTSAVGNNIPVYETVLFLIKQ
ncbi:MAG: tail fiber protein [bacterium]|nr:tail fiber protein [bacterium]